MRPTGLGIVGSGFMGQTHIAAAAGLEEFISVAVAGGSRALEVASRYGIEAEASAEDLIARSDVGAVVVATPHYLHAQDALVAIEAGKPVLIEKPIATTVEDCDVISAASASRRVAVGMGYHQRFRRNVREARRLLREGKIGVPLDIQISMPSSKPNPQNVYGSTWGWWQDKRSVGHIINSGPHAIDLLRWCLHAEVKEVHAYCRYDSTEEAVENTTFALIKMDNDVVASIYSTNALPFSITPEDSFHVRITGSRGRIDLCPYTALKLLTAEGQETVCSQEEINQHTVSAFGEVRLDAYRSQLRSFHDLIEGRTSECGSLIDGVEAVKVCLAMLDSSAHGQSVALR